MSARLDDNGVALEIGALMDGCCDECAAEPAFWHECDECNGSQLCAECDEEWTV
jgi:hypothetical protein